LQILDRGLETSVCFRARHNDNESYSGSARKEDRWSKTK
jgi:hypothetical protein